MSEKSLNLSSEADPLRFDLSPESIGPVFQLPEQVRSKWQTSECTGPDYGTDEEDPDLCIAEPQELLVCLVLAHLDSTFAIFPLMESKPYSALF